jgi:hypothetical protein
VVGPNTTTITTAIQPTLPSSHKSSSAQPLPSIESSIYFLSSWCKKVLTLLVSVFSFPPLPVWWCYARGLCGDTPVGSVPKPIGLFKTQNDHHPLTYITLHIFCRSLTLFSFSFIA